MRPERTPGNRTLWSAVLVLVTLVLCGRTAVAGLIRPPTNSFSGIIVYGDSNVPIKQWTTTTAIKSGDIQACASLLLWTIGLRGNLTACNAGIRAGGRPFQRRTHPTR